MTGRDEATALDAATAGSAATAQPGPPRVVRLEPAVDDLQAPLALLPACECFRGACRRAWTSRGSDSTGPRRRHGHAGISAQGRVSGLGSTPHAGEGRAHPWWQPGVGLIVPFNAACRTPCRWPPASEEKLNGWNLHP